MTAVEIDVDRARDLIVEFLRTSIEQARAERAVIGLSGGVDSSLTAFVAAEAIGGERVTAVMMPYRTNPPHTVADAREVAERLGIDHHLIDISPQVDAYFARYPDADRIRRGNKMARERMSILYDWSRAQSGVVIGSGNKTEALLGYTTLWGDMGCDFAPLGDLYKTQVRQLARAVGVPAAILDKPPSAGLWPGQTDEGEMGIRYEDADQVLFALVEEGKSRAEVTALGIEPAVVDRVIELMEASTHKRRLPPTCPVQHLAAPVTARPDDPTGGD